LPGLFIVVYQEDAPSFGGGARDVLQEIVSADGFKKITLGSHLAPLSVLFGNPAREDGHIKGHARKVFERR